MKKPAVLFLLAVAALCISCSTNRFADIQALLPDLSDKADGTYRGEYNLSGAPVKVVLDVVVRNHIITSINIIQHIRSPIGKKAERITGSIIERQSLDVDVISGATGSSKAILKAVENALK
jgi:uncharacterized protein with FMN-binding domain